MSTESRISAYTTGYTDGRDDCADGMSFPDNLIDHGRAALPHEAKYEDYEAYKAGYQDGWRVQEDL